jgi:hypothetical protein
MDYWILQSKPSKRFQIIEYLDEFQSKGFQQDFWHIGRHYKMKYGDIAFIWKANDKGKKDRGIYAKAKILTEPKLQALYELEGDQAEIDRFKKLDKLGEPYWVDLEEKRKLYETPLIWVEYTKFILDKPLLLNDNAEVKSILYGTSIVDVPKGIVHILKQHQGQALEQMIDSM